MLQGAEWRDLVATNMYTSDGRKVDKQILDTYFHKDQWVNSSKPVRREPGNLACAPGRLHKYLFWRLVVPKAADEDATAGDGDDDAEEQTAAAAKAAASKAKRVAELVKAGHAQLQLDVAHVRWMAAFGCCGSSSLNQALQVSSARRRSAPCARVCCWVCLASTLR
jgi:hypothetical protein